jgi:hypothetical protein
MGYTTDFTGRFDLDQPLTRPHEQYLSRFSETRRMRRDASLTAKLPDTEREGVELPIGEQGGYYVGDQSFCGQSHTEDILDYNDPPDGQPGLWCQWVPTEDAGGIEWNGTEKFYCYTEWLVYLIEHFLKPWGYTLSGTVTYQGEESGDFGEIVVKDNEVFVREGKRSLGRKKKVS